MSNLTCSADITVSSFSAGFVIEHEQYARAVALDSIAPVAETISSTAAPARVCCTMANSGAPCRMLEKCRRWRQTDRQTDMVIA